MGVFNVQATLTIIMCIEDIAYLSNAMALLRRIIVKGTAAADGVTAAVLLWQFLLPVLPQPLPLLIPLLNSDGSKQEGEGEAEGEEEEEKKALVTEPLKLVTELPPLPLPPANANREGQSAAAAAAAAAATTSCWCTFVPQHISATHLYQNTFP